MSGDRRCGRTDERGFTLLEMIVALVVLALVMGLLASGAQLLRGTRDRLAQRSEALADVVLVTDLLQTRLGDAVALDMGPAGRTVAAFEGTADRLRFVALAPSIAPGEPLVAWQLGLDATGGLALGRAELGADEPDLAVLDADPATERRRLAADVVALTLDYFGRKAGDAAATWHADWLDQPRLPRAVRLTLGYARLALPPIIVPIHQMAGTLCPTPEAGVDCEVS
jgi:general secretion pathway protein J